MRTVNSRTRPSGNICVSGTPGSTWNMTSHGRTNSSSRTCWPSFPAARFLVLIRDYYTWLQSITGHLTVRDVPGEVVKFLRWWFKPDRYPHDAGDRVLADRGLFSVSAYLHAWNRHVDCCIRSIPAERRLVLRTNKLGTSHRRLAGFLGIPVSSLDRANGHRNRGVPMEPITSIVVPGYIDELVHSICGVNMARYFPELGSATDVPGLWA